MSQRAKQAFWGRTKRLTLALGALWLLVNLAVPWFARELNAVRLFGFPLGYWLAAQGALFVYLAIIVVYALAMDRYEASYLAAQSDAAAAPDDA
jgi:putative solute:sodium symporter small subunit